MVARGEDRGLPPLSHAFDSPEYVWISVTGLYAWLRWASNFSYVAALVDQARQVRHQERFLLGTTVDLPSGEHVQIVPQFHLNNVEHAVHGNPPFDIMIDTVAELNALAASRGVACLVVLFPSKEEVYGQFAGREFPDLATPVRKESTRRGLAIWIWPRSFVNARAMDSPCSMKSMVTRRRAAMR